MKRKGLELSGGTFYPNYYYSWGPPSNSHNCLYVHLGNRTVGREPIVNYCVGDNYEAPIYFTLNLTPVD